MEREKKGDSCLWGEKNVLIAKVKNSIILPERQGKWIPISVLNFNKNSNNDFLFPVLLNTIIEHNLVVSKFSPQAGVLRSPSMYMFNNNNIFIKVRNSKTMAKLVNLAMQNGDRAEDRDLLNSHHFRGIIRDRTIPTGNPQGSRK